MARSRAGQREDGAQPRQRETPPRTDPERGGRSLRFGGVLTARTARGAGPARLWRGLFRRRRGMPPGGLVGIAMEFDARRDRLAQESRREIATIPVGIATAVAIRIAVAV